MQKEMQKESHISRCPCIVYFNELCSLILQRNTHKHLLFKYKRRGVSQFFSSIPVITYWHSGKINPKATDFNLGTQGEKLLSNNKLKNNSKRKWLIKTSCYNHRSVLYLAITREASCFSIWEQIQRTTDRYYVRERRSPWNIRL